ncbi:MAG: hypothetical protein ACE5HQ_11070 [Gemmatimonadota bacterium]
MRPRRCRGGAAGTLGAALLILGAAGRPLTAQESLPRLTFAGTGLVSFNFNAATGFGPTSVPGTDFGTVNDFSDSFLLVRLDRQLFENDRAGMVIGFLFPDSEADLGDVFFNQVHVFYNSRIFGGRLGRTRLSNFLLEFPTVREEDLIEYGFVDNAFSDADNSEFSRYGNVVRAELFQFNSRLVLAGQAANWTVTDSAGQKLDDFNVNAVSGSLVYRLPPALRFQGLVRQVGIQVVSQNVDLDRKNWMSSLLGSMALNLSRNPLRNVEFRAQSLYNFGIDSGAEGAERERFQSALSTRSGRARAEALALVGSLRVLRRPYQLERFQAALTAAYKNYVGLDGSQFAVVPNVFFQIGQGVDVGLQYRYEQFDDALAEQTGRKRDHSVQLTLAFRFQMMFNDYFGERDDILNLEHGYIP